jgi:hypothetical protein
MVPEKLLVQVMVRNCERERQTGQDRKENEKGRWIATRHLGEDKFVAAAEEFD